ncbi:spore coat putative kinase YutH [Pseudalkalibacillus berkeleyi]|uniref:Spore coat protein YutH n=1 Tax=Pseudalkalibacillus berkeleyi TaxID=1069813 RepID=A0ABS9H0L6_9BACL|nr:spore coat protein YutH [Pseudalkalibacillus berkeleyi]MCF6138537.1 spore coat protein YutH [Pseudalkalibacillus berkeleyi]
MLEREIYHHFNLYVEQQVRIGGYEGFRAQGRNYVLVPIIDGNQQRIHDMQTIIRYLMEKGVKDLPLWAANQRGKWVSRIEGQDVLLFELPQFERGERGSIGKQLGQFHKAGEQIPYMTEDLFRYNEWVPLWTSRLDTLKETYNRISEQGPSGEFDYLFYDSFPYYEGLTENAIQYIVDYEFDRNGKEEGSYTITHERFHAGSWVPVKKEHNLFLKLPLNLVIDHPIRDVAEYIRYLVTEKAKAEDISTFLNDYTQEKPITRGGWRLLYGRLLYPATYFDVVETHYNTSRSSEQSTLLSNLKYVLSVEENHESFMKNFFNISSLPRNVVNIEPVGWLTKS